MHEIKCDSCSADLSTTAKNSIKWRFVLEHERIPQVPGEEVTTIWFTDPVETAYHFCGLDCLRKWVTTQKE